MKYTREDYMSGKCTHSEYYAQWVTPATIRTVTLRIGEWRIRKSTDPHFNDIPLHEWDNLHWFISGKSLSDSVCIAKEAARQIKQKGEEI